MGLSAPSALPQLTPATAAQSGGRLPNLGEDAGMGVAEERRLGERIARELYLDPDYFDDPILQEYVDRIWQPLLAAARARGDLPAELDGRFAFEVLMGRDRVVNAFALPGGFLGLHAGLVAVVSSRDELAAVLAHELSHVTQRHIARLTAKQSQQTPWVIGAMILGALAASRSPNAAAAAITGGQAVAQQNALNFSRDMEREADRIGFGVLQQAGFDPQGAVGMFDKLLNASRLNDSGQFPYLRSHPLSTERMADMRSRLGLEGLEGKPTASETTPTLLHAMVAARAKHFGDLGADAAQAWQQQVTPAALGRLPPHAQAGALYGAALSAMQQRDWTAAQHLHTRLQALLVAQGAGAGAGAGVGVATAQAGASSSATGANRATGAINSHAEALRLARLLAAELALLQGQPQRTLDLLAGAGADRPETLLTAAAEIAAGQPGQAVQALRVWTSNHPRDASAWQLLSNAHTALSQPALAARAQAEARAAHYDYTAAQDRLKAAQDLARQAVSQGRLDHIEASIIDARLRAVSLLARAQSQDAAR